MKRAIAIADHYSGAALRLALAAHVLFLLTLAAAFLFAAGRAHAATEACVGKDMLASFEAAHPAEFAKVEAEAARTPNGKGLLWKIEKDGAPPSYLFGTMHMTDPRVTQLTPAAQKAFEGAGTVVIETTDVLDKSKMMEALAKKPELMMFTDATTLTSMLSADDKAALEKGLAERGIPLASVLKMKPWILVSMIALPACEMARQAEGAPVLDVKLAEEAKATGKTIAGLETLEDQLGAMASLPMEFHMRGLIDSLKLGGQMDDIMETMIVLYEREDTGLVAPLINAVTETAGADNSGYADFEKTMVTSRNLNMAAHAEPILAKGGAFVAVGALHLPGPQGLVELLRTAGYTVTPAG